MNIFESLENLNVSEECFDEIMGIVEELLIEGSNLRGVVKRAYRANKIGIDKSIELGDKAERVPSDNDYHVNDKGEIDSSNLTGKTATKRGVGDFLTDIRREKNGRDEDELSAKRWNDEKNGYKRAITKAIERHKGKGGLKESLTEEILGIVEDIISEVSTETALKVHNKRVENADKAFWDEDEKFQKYANARKELREHPGYKTVGFTPLDKAMDTVNAEKEWEKAKKVKKEN